MASPSKDSASQVIIKREKEIACNELLRSNLPLLKERELE